MQPLRVSVFLLPVLCAFLFGAGTVRAESAASSSGGKGKADDHSSTVYVKDGDKYREATPEEIKTASEHAHSEGGLSFTGIKRYDLGIYTLIVFGLLMFVLAKFAWPHMREGLEKREANIKSALEQARQGQAEATALLSQAKRELDETASRVKAMLDDARRDADTLRADQREAGVKDAQAERERAKREIEAAKDVALKDIYDQSVRLAALMSEKALRRKVSTEDHRRLLDEALTDLKASKA